MQWYRNSVYLYKKLENFIENNIVYLPQKVEFEVKKNNNIHKANSSFFWWVNWL